MAMYTQQCFFGTWKNSLNFFFTPQMRILDDNQHERLITKFMAPKKQKKNWLPCSCTTFFSEVPCIVWNHGQLTSTTDFMGSLK